MSIDASSQPIRTHFVDIRTVSVPVADQDRAVSFYVDTFGFEKRMDAELAPGFRWVEVAVPGATTSLALVAGQPGVDTGIRLTTSDAQADHAALRGAGVEVDDLLLWDGVPPMFSFRDLDGNTLYVVQED